MRKSSLHLGEGGSHVCVEKQSTFAEMSTRNNQSGKEENSTPAQTEHKVNVEVLGEQTACLIV